MQKDVKNADIIIYDGNGMELKKYPIEPGTNKMIVSMDGFSSGTYFYTLQIDGVNTDVKKLVVINN